MRSRLKDNISKLKRDLQQAENELAEFDATVRKMKLVTCKKCADTNWIVKSDSDLFNRKTYRDRIVHLICKNCGLTITFTESGGSN